MRSRAYRRHQRARTKARHLRAYNHTYGSDRFPPPKDIAVRHPHDCGGRCFLCHGDKLLGIRPAGEAVDWHEHERRAEGW